MGLIDF